MLPAIDMINHSTEPDKRNTLLRKSSAEVSATVDGAPVTVKGFFTMKAGIVPLTNYANHLVSWSILRQPLLYCLLVFLLECFHLYKYHIQACPACYAVLAEIGATNIKFPETAHHTVPTMKAHHILS